MDNFDENFDKAPEEPQSNLNILYLQRNDNVCETLRQITYVPDLEIVWETLRKDPGRCGILEETVSKICNDVLVVEGNVIAVSARRGNAMSKAETESREEKAKVKSETKSRSKSRSRAERLLWRF